MTVIVRYVFRERLMHALSGLSYVYLLLTGLAFWTPALYWIAVVLGGGYLTRLLHPWVGLVFSAAVLWMYLSWRRDMRITPEDRAWRRAMRFYMRNEDEKVPPAGRFNFGQKQLFWLMVVGGSRAPALRDRALVRGIHSVGAPWLAIRGRAGARRRGAGDDWRLHHPSLHGTGGRSQRIRGHPARQGHRGMGAAASPAVAGADPFRGSRRNGRFEAGKYRRTIRTRRHRTGSCPSA